MSETVTRHRGGGRDEDGKIIPSTSTPLKAFRVAPGASRRYTERAREGLDIAMTVYFPRPVDLVNTDELTVRGERYQVVVNSWRSGRFDGQEVLCTRGEA